MEGGDATVAQAPPLQQALPRHRPDAMIMGTFCHSSVLEPPTLAAASECRIKSRQTTCDLTMSGRALLPFGLAIGVGVLSG